MHGDVDGLQNGHGEEDSPEHKHPHHSKLAAVASFYQGGASKASSMKSFKRARVAAETCVNLRDCGSIDPALKKGVMFRCSQVMSAQDLVRLDVKSILDLRVMTKDCKKEARHFENPLQEAMYDAAKPAKRWVKLIKEGSQPPPKACKFCSVNFSSTFDLDAHVFHADLMPAKVKAYIFYRMPRKTKLRTLCSPLWGSTMEAVMAPAVADDRQLGYAKLYQLLLEHAKPDIAKALRVFTVETNYPILVHCIHGKDRTGLIVMLVMLLCHVPKETVVLDYVQSEVSLKEGRDRNELEGVLAGYLTTDPVIASTAETMKTTIEFLLEQWGSIERYAATIGLSSAELSAIRVNMLLHADPADLLERISIQHRASMLLRRASMQGSGRRLAAASMPMGSTRATHGFATRSEAPGRGAREAPPAQGLQSAVSLPDRPEERAAMLADSLPPGKDHPADASAAQGPSRAGPPPSSPGAAPADASPSISTPRAATQVRRGVGRSSSSGQRFYRRTSSAGASSPRLSNGEPRSFADEFNREVCVPADVLIAEHGSQASG